MPFSLREPTKKHYSTRELQVFESLPQDGSRIKTHDLAELVFSKDDRVQNKRVILTNVLRTLNTKFLANKEGFRLERTSQTGPHSHEVWLRMNDNA